MASFPRLGTLLPAAALLCGLAAAPQAASPGNTDNTQFLPVWLAPGGDLMRVEAPALLNMPPGWATGDAAVVLAPGGAWPPGLRDRLVAALLDAGAAVLEINPPRPGRPPATALREELAAALATLHDGFGAGLVVAIGHDAAGDAAMEAGAAARTREGWGYAALVRLGPGLPRLAVAEVAEPQAWPARAPLLCDLLAGTQGSAAPGYAAACRAGLAGLR